MAGGDEGPLREYRRKRDAARTPEPVPDEPVLDGSAGGRAQAAGTGIPSGKGDLFVIQEHHARALHWDFRLERDGVLVSWALPKGLPQHPKDNHLAVQTEDHPMEYASFAGDIPSGEYGGGRVTVWDRGRYDTEKWSDREVMVVLHGARAQGRYVLFATGRGGRDWMIHRMDPPSRPDWQRLPRSVKPMLARPGRLPPPAADAQWGYEVDWQGARAVGYVDGGRLRLVLADPAGSLDVTRAVPELRELGASLGGVPAVLDGELVAVGGDGRPDATALALRLAGTAEVSAATARRRAEQHPLTYLLYDLVHLDGRSLLAQPFEVRRRLLDGLELGARAWRTAPWFTAGGREVLAAAAENGMPGILAKRLRSPYRPGERSRDWRRIPAVTS
ncbi:MAG: DNA polymerase ligase N-terminal domain-containing protein [Dermatophilaceae bacterium]